MKRSKSDKFVGSIAHVSQIKLDAEFAVLFVDGDVVRTVE